MSTLKGRQAEDAACHYLECHGYEILDRNRRLARGELDIVAFKDDVLVFVEVKAHRHRASSLLAMHADKCKRFASAAKCWLGLHEAYAKHQCRFDLVLVLPRTWKVLPAKIEHLLDVMRL